MAIAFTPSPTYPTTKKPVHLDFVATEGGAAVRLFCTDAPLGSKLREQITGSSASRVQVHEGDIATPFEFNADASGVYTFVAQEIQKPTFAGGFKGDPRALIDVGGGALGTQKVLGETVLRLNIGTRLTMPLGVGQDVATLVLWVWEDTIRSTSVALHGETTPAVVNPSSAVATTAALSASVLTALAALYDEAAVLAVGSFVTMISTARAAINLHLADTATHYTADTSNTIPPAISYSNSKGSTPKAVAKMVELLRAHMSTDMRDGATSSFGPGSGDWHQYAGFNMSDGVNAMIAGQPTDVASAVVAFADLWRAYEAHRVDAFVHQAPDETNSLTALPPLFEVHRAFLESVQSISPTPAASENPGAPVLIHGAGMRQG